MQSMKRQFSINHKTKRYKMQQVQVDQEALALSKCYALLIRKAQERRARLAAQAAAENAKPDTVNHIDGAGVESVEVEGDEPSTNGSETVVSTPKQEKARK
jgi:hypothetical protein